MLKTEIWVDLSYFYQFSYKKNLLKCIKYQWNERTKYKFIPNVSKMTFVITKLYKMFENDICDTKLYQMSKNDPNTEIFTVFGQTKCHSLVICYEWMLNFSSLNNS